MQLVTRHKGCVPMFSKRGIFSPYFFARSSVSMRGVQRQPSPTTTKQVPLTERDGTYGGRFRWRSQNRKGDDFVEAETLCIGLAKGHNFVITVQASVLLSTLWVRTRIGSCFAPSRCTVNGGE